MKLQKLKAKKRIESKIFPHANSKFPLKGARIVIGAGQIFLGAIYGTRSCTSASNGHVRSFEVCNIQLQDGTVIKGIDCELFQHCYV
jgi:hypothetical protein